MQIFSLRGYRIISPSNSSAGHRISVVLLGLSTYVVALGLWGEVGYFLTAGGRLHFRMYRQSTEVTCSTVHGSNTHVSLADVVIVWNSSSAVEH